VLPARPAGERPAATSARRAVPKGAGEPVRHLLYEVVEQHVNERIDPFTGKPQIHAVDLVIPGNGGLDIQVQRACLLR
jgi:hypothetical protein